ncbi:MAG: hypothetical protein K5872_06315 [Rhizobiaceae bacterium]|nr:hypothetical protein [Rhizobiaceae bacterium]MCV0405828.1 hypothetical protein [Rhizobiaceae bacterium]
MSRSVLVLLPAAMMLATVPLAGCTRTHDGSIVPVYQTKVVRTGALPRVAIARTPTEPGPRVAERIFPAQPARAEPPPRRQIARTQRRPAARPAAAQPSPRVALACREETGTTGRVRVVCH